MAIKIDYKCQPRVLKNIIWDLDGPLTNLDLAYLLFMREHENWKDYQFEFTYHGQPLSVFGRDLRWEHLSFVLPMDTEKFGALDLTTHPTMGKQMTQDFVNSKFFHERPLHRGTLGVLAELKNNGIEWQGCASASHKHDEKVKMMRDLGLGINDGGCLHLYSVEHGAIMSKSVKREIIEKCLASFNLNPAETLFVDDRIYNFADPIALGLMVARARPEFTSDLPKGMQWIPEFETIQELRDWVLGSEKTGER